MKMPFCFPGASKTTVFTVISLFLLSGVRADEVFYRSLEEGKIHGERMLSEHEDILVPGNIPKDLLPGYTRGGAREFERKGKKWTDAPDEMTPQAETVSRDFSGASAFMKESAENRPAFVIDPGTDPVIRNSRDAMENTYKGCGRKETCSQYEDTRWTERRSCYEQVSMERRRCSIKKTVTETRQTESWRYMTLEFDRNDLSAGFSAAVDPDGADTVKMVRSPFCVNRGNKNLWGNYGGFTIRGPGWKNCVSLQDSGSFRTEQGSVCARSFGETAKRGAMPLGDGREDSLQSFLFSALAEKFPPPEDAAVDSGTIERVWNRARRCGDGDGDGSGRRVFYTATRTSDRVEIDTRDGCRDLRRNALCGVERSVCLSTVGTDGGEDVCTEELFTFRCATGPLREDSDCAELRGRGCRRTGAQCLLWSEEDPELPDPPGKPLGKCLARENAYDCPRKESFCRRKKTEVLCPSRIRCSSGGDCFSTETEHSENFPEAAARMEVLSDMGKCLATTRDGQSPQDGYRTVTDEVSGERAEPIDCADSVGGEVTIFKGKRYRCDLNLAGFIQNCCGRTGIFRGSCPAGTGILRARRDKARACRYVGLRKKKVLGVTIKKQKVYCCFNSKTARVVHEQARPQLIEKGLWRETENGGWGSARDPECGGITAEQLQAVDFSEMDFSEIYGDLLRNRTVPLRRDAEREVEEKMKKLCGRGENRPQPGCGRRKAGP